MSGWSVLLTVTLSAVVLVGNGLQMRDVDVNAMLSS